MARAQSTFGWFAGPLAMLLLATVTIVLAIGGYLFARSTIADLETTLQSRLEATARLRTAAEQSRQILTAPQSDRTAALAGDFLAGTQDPIIVAELQNRLRAIAISNHAEFNSANTLPAREFGGISYLGLRIQLRGQLRDIQSVLHAVEAGSPLLYVDRLAMRVDTWPIKSEDPSRDGAPALVAEMDVVGAKHSSPAAGRQSGAAPGGSPGDAPSQDGGAGAPVPWLSSKGGGRS